MLELGEAQSRTPGHKANVLGATEESGRVSEVPGNVGHQSRMGLWKRTQRAAVLSPRRAVSRVGSLHSWLVGTARRGPPTTSVGVFCAKLSPEYTLSLLPGLSPEKKPISQGNEHSTL